MLKLFHVACVYLSITGFILRGIWLLNDSHMSRYKMTKILPHIVDTLLLISGISLAVTLGVNPLTTAWLGAKLLLLLVYIALGLVAFRFAKGVLQRAMAWMGAMLVSGYMMSIAITKSLYPLAFFL